ncbi:MAG: OmpA family protein [Bacteroidales bacterium]|nr:OmpA family protein [Bacteroidales bacterium]
MERKLDITHHSLRSGLVRCKGILILLTLLLTTTSLSAQNFVRRGFAFGADRDTMLYIIASPFDNWYLNVGIGPQTFIGNELEASARHNKLNYYVKAEIGKWIIPDVSIALKFSYFSVDGQTRYGLHPFVDFTGAPTQVDPNDGTVYFEYQPFHAYAFALMGYVTIDWTNFFSGYEIGRRTHTHFFTPLGLGFSALHGKQINPRGNVGEFRINWELSYSVGLGIEYELSQKFSINAILDIMGSESTWDWSPYDNSYSRFDIIPSLSLGARFNLLKKITKRDIHNKITMRVPVNHEFQTVGGRKEVPELKGRISVLNNQLDSLEERKNIDSNLVAELKDSLVTLQNQLDSMPETPATNVMEAFIQNEMAISVVYFDIDNYAIDRNARYRLRKFAKAMERAPDTLEYYIIGAADSLTGSKRHNDWLSEKRCKAVFDILVNDYGADRNQLNMVPVGGITAYEPNEENRMAMIVIRNKEADEIIAQWSRYKK